MVAKGSARYRLGDLSVDVGLAHAIRGDTEIPLPRLSFDLLLVLIQAAPNLVSIDELQRRVWPGLVVSPETVSQRVKLLRRALGDDPNNPRYILGIRGRGYRLVAPVALIEAETPVSATVELAAPVAAPSGAHMIPGGIGAAGDPMGRRWPYRKRAVLAAASLLAGIAMAVAVSTLGRQVTDSGPLSPEPYPTAPRPVVAVLPFANHGVSADRSLADGLQSEILAELSRNPSLDVVAATSVEGYRDRAVSSTEAGQVLGATHVLEGSVQKAGKRMRIQARLRDTRTSGQVWAEEVDREFAATELFVARNEIVRAVTKELELESDLTAEVPSGAGTVSTHSLDAWAAENAARVLLERRTPESLAEAERLFRDAITLDPKYARAYAGLADAVWLKAEQVGLPLPAAMIEAERLVNQALRLDSNLAEALTTRAKIAQERLDFPTAEAVYKRVFELNPSYAPAYGWYSQLLYQQGREVEAREATRRAVELDPMSALKRVNMGLSVAKLGDLSQSLAWMEKAREIDPMRRTWAVGKAMAFAFSARFDEALRWERVAHDFDPQAVNSLVRAARWHLELDDPSGARIWLENAMKDGRQVYGSHSHAGLLALYNGGSAEAIDFARRALALDPFDTTAFMVLDADFLGRRDPAKVIATVQSSYPELAGNGVTPIRRASLMPATDLALGLQMIGDAERSRRLLDAASAFLAVARRNGTHEYFIDEIRVAAIRGDENTALQLLAKLVEKGWRGPYWRFYRDFDPALDELRQEPLFKQAFTTVEQDIRSQRLRAMQAGDLDPPDLNLTARRATRRAGS